jgi:hypothetical protein
MGMNLDILVIITTNKASTYWQFRRELYWTTIFTITEIIMTDKLILQSVLHSLITGNHGIIRIDSATAATVPH